MQTRQVFLNNRDASVASRYGLNSESNRNLFDNFILDAVKMFADDTIILAFAEQSLAWSDLGRLDLDKQTQSALMTWLGAHTALVQTASDPIIETLNSLVAHHSHNHIHHIMAMPLLLTDGQLIGGLFVCGKRETPYLVDRQTILTILAKNLTTQLDLYKQNNDLEDITELYALITETNQDLIFAKDKEFRLVIANKHFLSLYPQEMRDKVIGYTTLESYPQDEVDVFLANDVRAFQEGRSDVIERITFPTGEIRTINTVKTRFELANGEPYILGVSRDITEKENLIAKLKQSNQDLDEFAYIASHDLKSPLNAIKRLVSFIEEDCVDQFDAATQKHFTMIKSRADRMLRLLSDLLSFAKIGRDKQDFQTMNLQEVASNCFELLDIPANFAIEIEDTNVTLPKVPLELVLTNLMSNAFKHHDKEKGKISVTCKQTLSDYIIQVTDDGPGIAKEMFDKIFEKFQTLKPRDQIEGSGLGLSMVQKTIEHYEGNVTVTSTLGHGTAFTLHWPIPARLRNA